MRHALVAVCERSQGSGAYCKTVPASACPFVDRWLGIAVYVAVALMWLVPDRRIERLLTATHTDSGNNST